MEEDSCIVHARFIDQIISDQYWDAKIEKIDNTSARFTFEYRDTCFYFGQIIAYYEHRNKGERCEVDFLDNLTVDRLFTAYARDLSDFPLAADQCILDKYTFEVVGITSSILHQIVIRLHNAPMEVLFRLGYNYGHFVINKYL